MTSKYCCLCGLEEWSRAYNPCTCGSDPAAANDQSGDWYCKNCGYIIDQRVTHDETCDQCHTPVEWHSVDEMNTLDQLRSQLTEATEAMHCAVLKIQDGSPHHAEGVLSDAIARLEDEGDKE